MKGIFQKREQLLVPMEFGKYNPDWRFQRKYGERNCDGMVRTNSMFDPENGAWTMCNSKAKFSDESAGLQYCARHRKNRPLRVCTHTQAIQIQADRAKMWEETQELLRAGKEWPFLKLLDRQQRQLEKRIQREWGKPLRWLSMAVANSVECGMTMRELYQENPSQLSLTLHMLHDQGCSLARAIVNHCRRGEIQSAIILWRSLFVTEVDMAYISRDTTQVPSRSERYYDWSKANYFYVNNLLSHEIMVKLQRKYVRWNLKHYDGWTAPPDNPKAICDVSERALRLGYSEKNKVGGGHSRLDIYNLCHFYVHNNLFGMLNDPLTSRNRKPNAPSIVGLDTPICLTAMSLTTITHLLLDNQSVPENELELTGFRKFADIQEHQTLLEINMVRQELLSPLGGIEMSYQVQSDDGTEYVGVPVRRGER